MASSTVNVIHELPYKALIDLCNIINLNNDWKELGSRLDFEKHELYRMEKKDSPCYELLTEITSKNITVLELFYHLYEMKHFQALVVLKPYVNQSYHRLILEGSGSINRPTDANLSDPLTPMNVLGGTPHIPYDELTVATNNWNPNNILGEGGFGIVFRGLWKNTPIAIKKLEVQKRNKTKEILNECEREQFLNELRYLGSCRHKNILPLDGISFKSRKYCLVYRYMENGSLENRLLKRTDKPTLTWDERLNIAKGAASGIQFLHAHEPPLIHGDIKSANILLNDHMEPVIGDFGLTQEGPIEKATHVTLKRVNGTRPYLPVDFLMDRKLSTKVDVHSFGMVLFELATGLHAKDLVAELFKENKNICFPIVDQNAPRLKSSTISGLFFKIGELCTLKNHKKRPEMSYVHFNLCGNS